MGNGLPQLLENGSSAQRRTPKRRRSEETYQRILQAAEAIIARGEVLDLSTNRIAQEAGVSVGAIYQYFPNKVAIIVALYQRALDRNWELLKEVRSKLGDRPSLDAFLKAMRTQIGPSESQEFSTFALALNSLLIPEVTEAERQHAERTSLWLTEMLLAIGTDWDAARLYRLAVLAQAFYTRGTWEAAVMLGGIDPDLELWRDDAVQALLEKALLFPSSEVGADRN